MTHQRILKSLAKNPGASDATIAKNLDLRVADVRKVRESKKFAPLLSKPMAPLKTMAPLKPVPTKGGIVLGDLRVLPRKPAENAAMHIKRLPLDKGFEPRVLAHAWGMSEETIKRHAKDLGCLKFVEVSPDEWVPMILSPVTAAAYHA